MAALLRKLFQTSKMVVTLSDPLKMVFVVRNDLNLGRGKIGAQCAHAAVICVDSAQTKNPGVVKAWLNLGQPKIVVRVNSLAEIYELERNAKKLGINYGLVRDAGKTQVTSGTITVIALGPDTVYNIDALTGHLKLL